jgi:hypothetical protein
MRADDTSATGSTWRHEHVADDREDDLPPRLIDQVIRHQVGVLWRSCDIRRDKGQTEARTVRVVFVDVKGQRNCVTALPAECFTWWVSWSRFIAESNPRRTRDTTSHLYVPEFDLNTQRRMIADGRQPQALRR